MHSSAKRMTYFDSKQNTDLGMHENVAISSQHFI